MIALMPKYKLEEIHTPQFLYHASTVKGLKLLTPRLTHKSPTPQLFAGNNPEWVIPFLIKGGNEWCRLGAFANANGDIIRYVQVSNRDEYQKNDIGGAVYRLSGKDFSSNLGTFPRAVPVEWVCSKPIVPLDSVEFDSAIKAMLELGVQLFYISQAQLDEHDKRPDEGWKKLLSIESENQKHNIGIRDLSKFPYPV